MKSNDEPAGETCAPTVEIGQLSIVAGMNSTSDSLSENAVLKTLLITSDASVSDDSVVHPKSEGLKVSEGRDDCLPCVSGRDEHVNEKCDTDDSMMKYNKPRNVVSGECFNKVSPSSSQTVLNPQDSGFLKSTDAGTGLLKVQNTSEASDGKYVSHVENPRDVKDNKPSATKKDLLEGSTEACDALSPRVIASGIVVGDPPATVLNSIQQNDDMEVDIQSIDEAGDSDIVEQDVKVCDICGDAGREDLLAICCRCIDGAEHTYCMREMLAKVPEGEWLCEECQALEHVGNGREESIARMDENEKNNSGHTSSDYVNNSDVEGERTKGSTRIPTKRHRDDDDAEVSSMVKKPALESKLGSPRPSNSGRTAALTREKSLKNSDKGKLPTPDTAPSNDPTESESSASDLRVHSFRGNFSKSNSFPKSKLVDQVEIQRQKSAKEPSSFHHKEGVVRQIGKSMSFKSTNPGRSESKVKMLSPRLSHIQDIKNNKQRGPFQRQHSFRTERPSINSAKGASKSSSSRIDKRLAASRGESSSPANHHETKSVQAEGKSAVLSRSSIFAARKAGDLPTSSGEFKRPSMHVNNTFGISSANVVNNNEHKYNKTSLKEEPPCSLVTNRPPLDANEGIADGLPRQKDSTNFSERMKDCSGSRNGPPPANEGGNVKAAIEAAVLRKPGLYRKHRPYGQSDGSLASSLGCDVASHQDPITKKKLSSDAELPEKPSISRNLTADSLKQQSSNYVKLSSLVPVEGVSPGGRNCVHINSSSRNMLSNVTAAMPSFLKSVAVPEHEYTWEGSFEIRRSDTTFCLWDGIQAHLSTCASPKVIEAVNKFENRIVLNEVPRLSTWPVHFQEHGVREVNIALFFFAKDLESYDKVYKVLLDNMMKNDLALKGNVNGVELLIFPSSQLPENSQRWNMLFFLWGVFRGKKESFLQQMPESSNQIRAPLSIPPPIMSLPENRCTPPNIPPPIMSLSENRCSVRPIEEDPNGYEDAASELGVSSSEELRQRLLLLRVGNRENCDTKTLDRVNHQLNTSCSPAVQSNNANQGQEMEGNSQKGDLSSSCRSPHAMGGSRSSGMLMQLDNPLGVEMIQQPSPSQQSTVSMVAGILKERQCTDEGHIMLDPQNQVKSSEVATEDGEILLTDQRRGTTVDLNNRWVSNDDEPMLPRPTLVDADASRLVNTDDATSLEKMNHHDSHQALPRNGHLVFLGCDESAAERRFFPTDIKQLAVGPTTPTALRKMHHNKPLLEQQRQDLNLNCRQDLNLNCRQYLNLNDRAPDLELALGAAESPPRSLWAIQQPLDLVGGCSRVDHKQVNEFHSSRILEQEETAKTKDDEDDVATAALSLSLSFPFPSDNKEHNKTEQQHLVPERERLKATSPMLLFGNFRDKIN